jgi:hypothetical protein
VEDQGLRVRKALHRVHLWIHPEGRVSGALYVREHSPEHAGREQPFEVVNEDVPFLVVRRNQPEELRFYNKASVIRVEYRANDAKGPPSVARGCRLHMMDGSLLEGEIREPLAPDRARLLDYLNQPKLRFLRLFGNDDRLCLVNKSYVICVTSLDD